MNSDFKKLIASFLVFNYMYLVERVKSDKQFCIRMMLVSLMTLVSVIMGPVFFFVLFVTADPVTHELITSSSVTLNYFLAVVWLVLFYMLPTLFLADSTLEDEENRSFQEAVAKKFS